jgi:hypothetical protein
MTVRPRLYIGLGAALSDYVPQLLRLVEEWEAGDTKLERMQKLAAAVRARPGRLRGLSVLRSKSGFLWRVCIGAQGS